MDLTGAKANAADLNRLTRIFGWKFGLKARWCVLRYLARIVYLKWRFSVVKYPGPING